MSTHSRNLLLAVAVTIAITIPKPGQSDTGDAVINYKLGLAAHSEGDPETAYKLFKKACMAENGIVDACLMWAELAEQKDDQKGVKRSLGSAILLDPGNIKARTMLAAKLIKKEDYPWAEEHLKEALLNAKIPSDVALIRYYLAYVYYRTERFEKATEEFEDIRDELPPTFAKRSDYYRALCAKRMDQQADGVALLQDVAENEIEAGDKWAVAAEEVLESWSSYLKGEGINVRLSGSYGVNTHPSSAFLDTVESEAKPVMQSIFRGDIMYNKKKGNKGFMGVITGYREQNWMELGEDASEEEEAETAGDAAHDTDLAEQFEAKDFNTTVFLAQAAFIGKTWGKRFEHELRFGVDGDVQFLDRPPLKDDLGGYYKSDILFKNTGWSLAGKVWWGFAKDKNTQYSLRLKVEGRPNYIDEDRSTVRYRLRLYNTRYSSDRKWQLKLMAGTRYDRAYHDPKVIKYDRVMPEAELSLRWNTPWSRLTAQFLGQIKYNWYLNSRQNQINSFRPQYLSIHPESPVPMHTDEMDEHMAEAVEAIETDYDRLVDLLNAYYEHEYYSLTRKDLEWELGGELQFNTWKGGQIVLLYKHHVRDSNIDDAPGGRYFEPALEPNRVSGEWETVYPVQALPTPRYSYTRDVVMIELRQRF